MTEKLVLQSPDFVNENIEKIAALFPNCVTETENGKAIDFDLLRQELNHNIVEGTKERYRLEWPGKREAIVTANLPTTNTLRPVPEESVDFENTENLYIEGDNLEVLKILQESYLGKIKMIYIDPPYNTGNDFVYKDNFTEDKTEHEEESGQRDELGRRLVPNPESSGRYHSDWLTMMYPRLKLARNLLTEDGVIFISIDDNENDNLRKVCDEIFGEVNFVGQVIVKSNPRGSQSKESLANLHEYILIYSRNIFNSDIIGHELDERMISEYKNENIDGKKYRLLGLRQRGGFWRRTERPSLFYPIYVNPKDGKVSCEENEEFQISVLPIQPTTGEEGSWRWSKEKLKKDCHLIIAKEVTRNTSKEWDIFQIDFLDNSENQKRTKVKSIWDDKDFNYQNGTTELKELLGSGIFEYSKPKFLLQSCFKMIGEYDAIVLDFFSGSATTAHAVIQLNAEDGGNRKYIMVQLPEETNEKSEAYKAGYKNICEIGKERIRRAGAKIKEELEAKQKTETGKLDFDNSGNPDNPKNHGSDFGFRVFKLDTSNMQEVYYRPQDYKQATMDLFADNVKPGRSAMDLVTQVMLDWGLPLSLKIAETKVSGKQVFKVAGNSLFACFDNGIDEAFAKEIAKEQPLRIVFRDSSFASDTAKENVKQLLKQLSSETEMRVI